jgi:hypothetical protein
MDEQEAKGAKGRGKRSARRAEHRKYPERLGGFAYAFRQAGCKGRRQIKPYVLATRTVRAYDSGSLVGPELAIESESLCLSYGALLTPVVPALSSLPTSAGLYSAIPAATAFITEGELSFSLEEKSSCITFPDVNSSLKAGRLLRHWRSFSHGLPMLFQLGLGKKLSNGLISCPQTRFLR